MTANNNQADKDMESDRNALLAALKEANGWLPRADVYADTIAYKECVEMHKLVDDAIKGR